MRNFSLAIAAILLGIIAAAGAAYFLFFRDPIIEAPVAVDDAPTLTLAETAPEEPFATSSIVAAPEPEPEEEEREEAATQAAPLPPPVVTTVVVTEEVVATPPAQPAPAAEETATTTFLVSDVPLLSGGAGTPGASIPLSYLQIINTGGKTATLKGFKIVQNGSASTQSIIELSTVDDQGGSRHSVGGAEGATPFSGTKAIVPIQAVFAPGQMRLFTIKATLSGNLSPYAGTNLMIDVEGIQADSSVTVAGQFPIKGTTWSL